MKRTILALAALGLMSAFSVKAGDVPPANIAHLTALITSDSEQARSFIQFMLKNIGDTSDVGDCSVFVKKTVGANSYLVAKVVLETDGLQDVWRAVSPGARLAVYSKNGRRKTVESPSARSEFLNLGAGVNQED